jgi:hypothetical protein
MSQRLNLSIAGLWTDPNQLGSLPPGALAIADNIVINKINVAESRRGQKKYGDTLTNILKLFCYRDTLLANYNGALAKDSDDAGTWVDFTGTFSPPAGANRIRSMEANRNFYLTSEYGVKKLDDVDSEFKDAGTPPALGPTSSDGEYSAVISTTGFLEPGFSVAYRMVWGYKDANNNEIVGAPSQRIIASNESTAPDNAFVTGSNYIPDAITTSYFYRIYRSAQAAVGIIPSDEMNLVVEGSPTDAEISAGIFSFNDTTPDDATGAALYTSPSQEGILQSNYEPPISQDMALYKGHAIYANTTGFHELNADLKTVYSKQLGVYSGSGHTTSASNIVTGLAATQTVVAQDLTYTAATSLYPSGIYINYNHGASYTVPSIIVGNNSIFVFLNSGVTTATAIATAWNLSAAAVALATVAISGGGGTPQTAPHEYFLAALFDSSVIAAGMKITGAGIPSDTFVSLVIDADSISLSKNATASATVTLSFHDIVYVGGIPYIGVTASPAADEFIISTDQSDPDILSTTLSLVNAINSDNTDCNAYYLGGDGDKVGSFFLRAKAYNTAEFSLYTTKPSSFAPPIPSMNYISQYTAANPTVVTSVAHGLTTGDSITIFNSNGSSSIDGEWAVTVTGVDTFTVPVVVSGAGKYAEWVLTDDQNYSTNNPQKNMLYISKFQQPEAVPLVNFIPVGSANYNITRVVTLNEYVYIFKEVEGIYRLTGDGLDNFRVDLFDASTILRVPESIAILNNRIYCFSSQGVVSIAGDVVDVDNQIRSDLQLFTSDEYSYFASESFGMSYETDNKYIFYTVTETDDLTPTQAYVWNYFTKTWTRWDLARSCGIIKPTNNKMYSGCKSPAFVYEERKQLSRLDYADDDFDVAIVSYSGDEVTLADTSDIVAGYTLKQGDYEALVVSVDSSTVITVNKDDIVWLTAAAKVYTPIETTVQWAADTTKNPGILKQFREVTLFFRRATFNDFLFAAQSNFSTSFIEETLQNPGYATWGNENWGDFIWGGGENPNELEIRTYVPFEKQRASWVNFRVSNAEAFTSLSLQGISVQYENMSERFF